MAFSSSRQRPFQSRPPSSDSDSTSIQLEEDGKRKKRKRHANVYDAVAGSVTTTNALEHESHPRKFSQRRKHVNLRDSTLAPEEVLFQRIGAPIRYLEKDIYNSHEGLPHGGRDVLPDNDMLKAVHNYSSHFYSALSKKKQLESKETGGEVIDNHSMDETALLAFGILLEEAGRDALGRRGDLVFTEGIEIDTEGQSSSTRTQGVGFLDVDPRGSILKRATRKAPKGGM